MKTIADKLAASGWTAAPRDAGLAAPRATTPLEAVDQMRRRGFDPALVTAVLPWLEGRPVELGLFSWDALVSGIYDDVVLVERLRANARVVREVLPQAGSAFADFGRTGSLALVERLAAPPYAGRALEQLDDAVSRRALGALHELVRLGPPGALQISTIPETTRQFAKRFELAHASTLASFYFDWLWRAVGLRSALPDLLEVVLDAGAPDALPSHTELLERGTDDALELYGYAQARIETHSYRHADLWKELAPHAADPGATPRTQVILAEAGLEVGQRAVPLAALDEVCRAHPQWRYAHRVRVTVLAHDEPRSDHPLAAVDAFLANFGNDFQLGYQLARHTAPDARWLPELRARFVREVTELPHDWAAWASLAALLFPDGPEPALEEIFNRAAAQSTL